ncbi:response regulator [Dactylosporangium matsuzakiense]|uniref:Two-component system response regulator n=2 Tax=Dactylosporangium matsuzakiense TaxID=53360 RepID=A0A9W6KGZ4_9ACTN|nr:response regulator [Dactylosporangium matsuzakiense]GLK99884.1 two-component system response regulator [Dactylosporangium matsuzakiense]
MTGPAAEDSGKRRRTADPTNEPLALVRILLVEDDPGDVAFTLDEFREHRLRNPVTVLGDGRRALDYLQQRGAYVSAPIPDILLLDLNLPGVDGRVVLDRVTADPRLAGLTVVVLTGSDIEERMLRDFGVPATHFFRKPVDFAQLIRLIRAVDELSVVIDRGRATNDPPGQAAAR